MRFGHFDDSNREYVITRPDTPLPWINYLGCNDYFGIISNTAGGYSFYKDARLRRLTRYRYNNAPLDTGGRYLYIRDEDGEFWSPTWQPVQAEVENYSCRHGMGYTIISSEKNGLSSEIRYFVPLDQTLEVWDLTLTNKRSKDAAFDLFSLVEFCLWDANDDATNFQRNYSIGEVEVENGVIYHKTEYRERRNHFAYFACSEDLVGFDTQRDAFLGTYGSFASPGVVKSGQSGNSIANGWQLIGSHHLKITLAAGESKRIVFLLGYQENPVGQKFDPADSQIVNKKTVKPVIQQFLQPRNVDRAFANLKKYWDSLLDRLTVTTPDDHTNRMVNIWNAYQCMITFNLSRSASYFESGIGRGMGFRDSAQDLLGFVHMVPDRARERILDLAATQLASGGAFHQYQTLTKRGNNGVGSGFNDDPLWLVICVSAYIKETGDWTILDEEVPFENMVGSESSLYDHLQRSINYTLKRLGPHDLPLIGRADWNDCLNLNCFSDAPGESFQTTTNKDGITAESVFIAGLFVMAAEEMAALAEIREGPTKATGYQNEANRMRTIVLKNGWDGAWFRRAYDDFGDPVGSASCEDGKIFIEPQGICVMAGIGHEDGKARQALDSVSEHLATAHGIVLLHPAYHHYHLELGEISSYPPGYKENGSIFCHTNPWIMIAEVKEGRGEKAFDYYSRINPSERESISELHRCEPYVYAQTIAGKEAPTFGEAKNSWLTGTAAWNYVAITQWILGIRPELNGLRIDPVLPAGWQGFTAQRIFRGVRYEISVKRSGPGNTPHILVDGTAIKGNVLPLPSSGTKSVKVTVTLA
jgi:cellobiose phosphorylase